MMFLLGFIVGFLVCLFLLICLGVYLSNHSGGAGFSKSDYVDLEGEGHFNEEDM